nr:AraC family transcriptional regulator [Kribbella soli]
MASVPRGIQWTFVLARLASGYADSSGWSISTTTSALRWLGASSSQRAVSHSVQAKPTSIRPTRHTVYRLCLREDPVGLAGLRVARALTNDPADPTSLDEWAGRLHMSAKTLQRDFRVGYSSASAYIAAFRRTFGRTPGQISD